jgi:hypothetical protein
LLLPINGGAGAPVGKTDRGLSGQPITPDGPEPAGIKNRPIEQKKESPPRAHARGSAFDDDGLDAFQPNETTTAEWAAEHVPELRDVSDPAILAAFKDYHKSKGTKLVDLPAAWRQWLRKEPEFAQRRNQSARPRRNERNKPGEMIETVLNELRKYSDGS